MRFLAPVLILAAAAAGTPMPAHAEGDRPPHTFRVHGFARPGPRLGVQITDLTEGLRLWLGAPRDAGVLVGDVAPDGAGARGGLKIGDVIVEVGGRSVTGADDIRAALAERKEGEPVVVKVIRDRKPLPLTVVVPKAEPGRAGGPFFEVPDGMTFDPGWEPIQKRLDDLEKRLEKLEKR
jgi:S1-C subfamily serine protease